MAWEASVTLWDYLIMTLLIVVLLVLLGVALRWRRKRSAGAWAMGLGVVMGLGVGCGPVPSWMLQHLQGGFDNRPPPQWSERNAIVLLGAGTYTVPGEDRVEPSYFAQGRLLETVELYRACKSAGADCKVFVTGGDVQSHGVSEAETYQHSLLAAGLPAADVQVETRSQSTWQNAQFTKPMLDGYGAQQILLVSSATHLKRSLLYFAHFGIKPLPMRGDLLKAIWTPYPQGWNFAVADAALHEYIGIARYYVYNAMGLNAPAIPARE